MSRIQLALNVTDLDEAVTFYSKLFATEPAKRKPGYANFAIVDPPLKLVLIEGDDGGTLNHLGVEVPSGTEVVQAEARLAEHGLSTSGVADSTCCYADKTETWVLDPDGAPWEVYVKLADADAMSAPTGSGESVGQCCSTDEIRTSVALGVAPANRCC